MLFRSAAFHGPIFHITRSVRQSKPKHTAPKALPYKQLYDRTFSRAQAAAFYSARDQVSYNFTHSVPCICRRKVLLYYIEDFFLIFINSKWKGGDFNTLVDASIIRHCRSEMFRKHSENKKRRENCQCSNLEKCYLWVWY